MKVRLKFPHTHADVFYKAGDTIEVNILEALWLKGLDLIEEGVKAIEAEARKLAKPGQPAPYAAELAKAAAAETAAAASAPAQPTPAAAPAKE